MKLKLDPLIVEMSDGKFIPNAQLEQIDTAGTQLLLVQPRIAKQFWVLI
jgi:hypothetical protein